MLGAGAGQPFDLPRTGLDRADGDAQVALGRRQTLVRQELAEIGIQLQQGCRVSVRQLRSPGVRQLEGQ